MSDAALAEEFLLPADVRARYYAAGYWRNEDLWESFDATARQHAARIAFVDGERTLPFAELRALAIKFGQALHSRGLGRGEVVVIHGRHCLEAVIAILGCAWGGYVAAPLPHIFSTAQIRAVAAATGSRTFAAFGEDSEAERVAAAANTVDSAVTIVGPTVPLMAGAIAWDAFLALAADPDAARQPMPADDPVLIIFSSGTTGEPKGVLHSSNTVRFAVETYARYQSIQPHDVSLVVTAFGFVGSTVLGIHVTFFAGCRTVLQRSWNAEAALELVARHRATHILLMPTHAIDVLDSSKLAVTDCSSLRRGVIAGLSAERREQARSTFCAMPFPMYGMSESPAHVTGSTDDDWASLRTTEGRALPGTEVLICDDEDVPVAPGTVGHILVRGPNRFLGYHAAPSLNRKSITREGYFRTGDVGFVDTQGFLTFVTRSKDIIRRGGVTITPSEVEAALQPHPNIADVAIIGLPDARLGERTCACVITRDGRDIDLEEICAFLERRGLARYQWPEKIIRCTSFPRTPSLKVQKNELRKAIIEQLARSSAAG